MPDIPEDIHETLRGHLTAIAKLFRAPLITLVVRAGDNAKGVLVLGNDNPSFLIEALRERMVADAKSQFAEPAHPPKEEQANAP